jgi:hypothetical protein
MGREQPASVSSKFTWNVGWGKGNDKKRATSVTAATKALKVN